MPIQCRACNPKLLTKRSDIGFRFAHSSLREAKLGSSHLGSTPSLAARARADARPAWVRSEISSRSNSASAAKMPKTSFPAGVVVLIEAPWPVRTFSPTPRKVRSWIVLTRCRKLRPSRSSFQTTSASPPCSAFRHEVNPGRWSSRPDAVSL